MTEEDTKLRLCTVQYNQYNRLDGNTWNGLLCTVLWYSDDGFLCFDSGLMALRQSSTYIFEVRISKFNPMIGSKLVSSLVRHAKTMAVRNSVKVADDGVMRCSEVFLLKIKKDRLGQGRSAGKSILSFRTIFSLLRRKNKYGRSGKLLRGSHVFRRTGGVPHTKHDSTPKMYLYIQEVCSYFGQTGHTAAFLIMMIIRPARLCSGLNVFILRGV